MDVAEIPHCGGTRGRAAAFTPRAARDGATELNPVARLWVLSQYSPCFTPCIFASAILLPFVLAHGAQSPVVARDAGAHQEAACAAFPWRHLLMIILLFVVVGGIMAAAISVPASEWIGEGAGSAAQTGRETQLFEAADRLPAARLSAIRPA